MNALQSFVFNKVVSERLAAGTLGAVVPGDLAWKHDNGAVFAVDEATGADAETKARAARFEISPSGPIWGPKMTLASGETDRVEVEALAGTGVTIEHIAAWEKRTRCPAPGARRPLRIPLLDPDVEGGADEHGEYVRVAFELPAGSYATVVLREIMKPERANASVAPA
jgi:tRNA pseudouridine13 synthase